MICGRKECPYVDTHGCPASKCMNWVELVEDKSLNPYMCGEKNCSYNKGIKGHEIWYCEKYGRCIYMGCYIPYIPPIELPNHIYNAHEGLDV